MPGVSADADEAVLESWSVEQGTTISSAARSSPRWRPTRRSSRSRPIRMRSGRSLVPPCRWATPSRCSSTWTRNPTRATSSWPSWPGCRRAGGRGGRAPAHEEAEAPVDRAGDGGLTIVHARPRPLGTGTGYLPPRSRKIAHDGVDLRSVTVRTRRPHRGTTYARPPHPVLRLRPRPSHRRQAAAGRPGKGRRRAQDGRDPHTRLRRVASRPGVQADRAALLPAGFLRVDELALRAQLNAAGKRRSRSTTSS